MTWSRLGNCQMSTIAPFSLSLAAKLLCEMWYLPTLIMLRSLLLLLLYRFFSQNWALWKELEKEFILLFKVVRYDDFIHEIIMSFSLFYLSFSSIFYVLKWVRFSFIAMLHNLVCQFLPLSLLFSRLPCGYILFLLF